jgi:TorA maturation chaperone TorD
MENNINQARAIFYDFFAGLFLRNLLAEREELIQKQVESLGSSPLDDYTQKSFQILKDELATHGLQNILDEFDDLFEVPLSGEVVFPYVSHYKNSCLNGEVLIDIRQAIKALPIRANTKIFKETEDHLGFLFLIMRYCIEANEYKENEKDIFSFYINPYVNQFIADIIDNKKSAFYKEIALILKSFVSFEAGYIK